MRYIVKSGGMYWSGLKWMPCQRCARRYNRKTAHITAHINSVDGGKTNKVLRLKKRAKQ